MQTTPPCASVYGCRLFASALAALTALALHAQSTTPSATTKPAAANEVVQLETYAVTGSNIKRSDQERTLPVTVITVGQIEARDSATPMDQLAGIPQITNIPDNEVSLNAVAARGDNANVALRGLGASNTLVILNGRRMPFHPFSSSNTSAVNVNTLPTFGIQQIEVLRDGASAIYGSDAVAGVINYVTKKKPTGGEISVRYGVTQHDGGMDVQGRLGFGRSFANGKGSWVLDITGYNRDAIYWREREYSKSSDKIALARPPFNVAGSAYDSLTATGIWPRFTLGTSSTSNYFYPVNGTPTLTTVALPRSLYADYNIYTTGQPMSARGSLYNRIEYDIRSNVRAFAEVSAYASKSQTGRQPITLSSSDAVVVLSEDNPYNPFGSRFRSATGTLNADGTARVGGAAQKLTIAAMILADGGPEKTETTDQMYRVLGGLEGTIGSSSWTWETAMMVSGVRATDFVVNAVRESKLKAAALRTDATAWNPFGYTFKVQNGAVVADQPYTNPAGVRQGYTQSANRYGHSKLASVDARAGGNVLNLWAGPIATSFGVEWRREFKEDHKDPFVSTNPPDSGLDPNNNDILVTSPKANYSAARTIASAYAEAVMPLTEPKNQIPLARSLELNVSARFEHYSDFGNTTKPKYGVSWKPFSQLMVRASLNQGYHAPDLADLHQPTAFTVASPPGERDAVRNNFFISRGMTQDVQVLRKTYNIGNPELQPEESKGKSVGIAVDVPKIKGLSLTADYWEIEQSSLILSRTRDTAVDEQLIREYTQSQLALGKSLASIDVGYHVSPTDPNTYVGEANTLRAPVTDADRALFAAANAGLPPSQQMATLGAWLGIISKKVNSTGRNFTNGFDYSVNYNLPRTSLGQFRFSVEWAQFLNKFAKVTPTAPKDDDIRVMLLPKSKSSLNVQWRNASWSASLNATYTSDVRTGATTNAATYVALGQPDYIKAIYNNGAIAYREKGHSTLQLNAGLGYRFDHKGTRWLRGTSFRLGLNNLLDEEPNRIASASGYSGSLDSSLWVGRAYTLNIKREF